MKIETALFLSFNHYTNLCQKKPNPFDRFLILLFQKHPLDPFSICKCAIGKPSTDLTSVCPSYQIRLELDSIEPVSSAVL